MTRTRIGILAGLLIVAALATSGTVTGWLFLHGQPAWYRLASGPRARDGAAERMEDKLILIYDRVAALHARHVQRQGGPRAGHSSTASVVAGLAAHPSDAPFQITFTDAELNAFFDKWADAEGRRAAMSAYVEDPRIQLLPDSMVLAARIKEFHTVISLKLLPSVDASGQLQMNLTRVYGGILPLPESLWGSERDRIVQMLDTKYAALQPLVEIAPDGTANNAAAAAGMNRLLAATLQHLPAAPTLFLPFDLRHPDRTVPTALEAVTLGDGTLQLRVREMSAAERDALFATLRGATGRSIATVLH